VRSRAIAAGRRTSAPALIVASALLAAACGPGRQPDCCTPAPVLQVAKVNGDGQTAAPGSAVAVAPSVRVTTEAGSPVAGVDVEFVVAAGGGSVAVGHAATDDAGLASCGGWTLGGSKGPNTLVARVGASAQVTFQATAAIVTPGIEVVVETPLEGGVVPDPVFLDVDVQSLNALSSVVASAGPATATLEFQFNPRAGIRGWRGPLSLATYPRGPVAIVVTVTDVLGQSTDAVVTVRLDRPPAVTITAPAFCALARPTIPLAVRCEDDDPAGCSSLTCSSGGRTLAQGTTDISQTLDLSPDEGELLNIGCVGIDSDGREHRAGVAVYVDSTPGLQVVATAPGCAWDFDAASGRTLALQLTPPPSVLSIVDAGGGAQVVEVTEQLVNGDGFLTADGAIYARSAGSGGFELLELRGGALASLGALYSNVLRVAGAFALHGLPPAPSGALTLVRRDLGAGTSATVTTDASPGLYDFGVAANGDVAFASPLGQVLRWRDGATTPLTGPGAVDTLNGSVVTDGLNVVYGRRSPDSLVAIVANRDGVETELAPPRAFVSVLDFAAAGGFVAYLRPDPAGVLQVWRHDPVDETQLTTFGAASFLRGIGADGTVVLVNGSRLYRARPGAALEDVATWLAQPVFSDGRLFLLLGGAVLELNQPP